MRGGYAAASVTVLIWGLTFISTKVLLASFTPVEILFLRFLIGTAVLAAASPRRLRTKGHAAGCSALFGNQPSTIPPTWTCSSGFCKMKVS